MLGHFTTVQLRKYHERAMPFDESLVVDEHLVRCTACRARLAEMFKLPDRDEPIEIGWLSSGIEAPDHLDFDEQIAPYVDGELGEVDREIVESHLELCAQCAEDVRELREFKDQLEAAPVVSALPPPIPQTPSWTNPFTSPGFLAQWRPVHMAGFAALSVLIAVGLLVVWRASIINPQGQFTLTEGANNLPVNSVPQHPSPQVRYSEVQPQDGARGSGETLRNLNPSDENQTAARASATPRILVALNDANGQVTLDERGNLAGADGVGPDARRAVVAALRTGSIEQPPAMSVIRSRTGVTLKGPEEAAEFRVLSPVGTVVLSDRPTFRWQAVQGATSYMVTVVDQRLNPVAASEPVTDTQWTPQQALRRGVVYRWQVAALVDGDEILAPRPPVGEARFKVLEGERANRLLRAARSHSRSHLTLGVMYAREGLAEGAEREFERLVELNPRSGIARALLQSVRRWHSENSDAER